MSDPVDLNLQELRELIKLLRESNVSEFEIRKADYRLRIKHGLPEEHTGSIQPVTPVNGKSVASVVSTAESPAEQTEESGEQKEELHEIRSPIVGTFFRSSSPDSAAFVEVGDVVRKTQVLCIVEAMKIMNEIESDIDGEIRDIHIANGQPVEFGELLFSIRSLS